MKLKIVVDHELEPLNAQQTILKNEFTLYKELSLIQSSNNFITPPIGIQMSKPSVHPSFGRDTEFEKPDSLINDILEYKLTKVHVDTRAAWLPHKEQWNCKSNESIVYSGFVMPSGTYCIVIIEFLVDNGVTEKFDAHDSYKSDDIEDFLIIAQENQETILAEKES